MKKTILITALIMIAAISFGQREFPAIVSIDAPADDTTWSEKFFTGFSWSIQFNYNDFDDTDATLTIYSAAEVDSTLYSPIWVDLNLDGTNDNPWTLADSTLTIWGDSWPFRYIVYKLTGNSVTADKKLFYWKTKQ